MRQDLRCILIVIRLVRLEQQGVGFDRYITGQVPNGSVSFFLPESFNVYLPVRKWWFARARKLRCTI